MAALKAIPSQLGTPAVLVVEDELMIRVVLVDELRDAGFLILEAADAAEGITLLNTCPDIRVLVTDIAMPGSFDGNELIRYTRTHFPAVKIIAATASLTHEPADTVLPKPYQTEHAIILVRRFLQNRRDGAPGF